MHEQAMRAPKVVSRSRPYRRAEEPCIGRRPRQIRDHQREPSMAEAASVTIFHNPGCGTSRAVLAALRDAGREPKVVEYLKTGWTKPQLRGLLAAMKAAPRDILRVRGTAAESLG